MCGIVGYIGKNSAYSPIIKGLKALEYRGYDSAGVSVLSDARLITSKQVGRVESLEKKIAKDSAILKASSGIGHTRWATHGSPTTGNAHPHQNTAGTISVVHNGIIENYQAIKARLEKTGVKFVSQTDTEVIPHLIDHYYLKTKDLVESFELAVKDLQGAFAIACISSLLPDSLLVARLSSPLIIGVGKGEYFIASDPTAIMEHTKKVIFLDDFELAVINQTDHKIRNFKSRSVVSRAAEALDFDLELAQLGDYPHFMLKEIFEAPQTIQSATLGRVRLESNEIKLGGLESVSQQLDFIDRIVIVACGTSYYASLVGEYLIEEIAGIPVEVQLASEFKYRHEPFSRSTALIAVSQSGETADTIAALKKVEDYGVLRLGVVNAVGSTIARMTDAGVYCHAGPEQSVASTKAFIAQVSVLALIALHLSKGRSKLYKPLLKELTLLPKKAEEVLGQTETIRSLAKKYAHHRDFMFIGRNYSYPCALEGALKLKEISYIHAEGYAAGEMKHGPLAMIDESFPTFAIATDSPLLEKTLSNIQEIKARKGPVLALASVGDEQVKRLADDVIYIPKSLPQTEPLLVAIVLQLFAYYVAVEKELDVDRPRNLAKSVTVE